MAEIDNESKYQAIKESLGNNSKLAVLGETTDSNTNQVVAKSFTHTDIVVAPKEGTLNLADSESLAAELLPGIQPVNSLQETLLGGEVQAVRLSTFEPTGQRSYHVTSVEVFPNQEAAQRVQEVRRKA